MLSVLLNYYESLSWTNCIFTLKKREQNGYYLYNGVCKTIEYTPVS